VAYKELFTLLDALSRSLDDKDIRTSSLDAKRNEFVVTLDKTDEMLKLPSAAIKENVVSALAASGIPRLQEAELKGIKVLPRGRVLVAAHDERTATRLKQTASYWTPKLSKNAQLVVPSYRVVVNSVPKSFTANCNILGHFDSRHSWSRGIPVALRTSVQRHKA
jgi:hypothetical protein